MQVVVLMRSNATRSPQTRIGPEAVPPDLAQVAAELGSSVSPMHPGAGDADLGRWFVMDVPDRATADQATDRLLGLPSVEAAYFKPQDELP